MGGTSQSAHLSERASEHVRAGWFGVLVSLCQVAYQPLPDDDSFRSGGAWTRDSKGHPLRSPRFRFEGPIRRADRFEGPPSSESQSARIRCDSTSVLIVARSLRFLPEGSLVEVTMRTVHGRLLLRPSRVANDLVVGVLGRAQRKYAMVIHALVFMSNHAHLLLSPQSPQQLAAFMDYVAGNIAREVGRLHDWREKFWGRRYRSILVSHEEEAQVGRLAYLLGNSVKEGLVERPHQWPGVHCALALCEGSRLQGTWFDRTAQYEARRRGENRPTADFATGEQVVFSPLPCWASLGPATIRRRVGGVIQRVVAEARQQRAGRPVFGKKAILSQDPHERPSHPDRSPAPAVHAASKAIRVMLRVAYWEFAAAFREAAQRLRRGDRAVRFPRGAFPPPLPSVALSG